MMNIPLYGFSDCAPRLAKSNVPTWDSRALLRHAMKRLDSSIALCGRTADTAKTSEMSRECTATADGRRQAASSLDHGLISNLVDLTSVCLAPAFPRFAHDRLPACWLLSQAP